jgi:hypothetical protein
MGVFAVTNGEPVLLQNIVKVPASADPKTALVK